jgi:hypothetical protein
VIEPGWCDFREPFREREGGGMAHLKRWRVVHGFELLGHCIPDFGTAMSGIHAPKTRYGIQNLPPFRGPVMHALRFRQDARLRFELAIGGEGHPQRLELGGRRRGSVRHGVLRQVDQMIRKFDNSGDKGRDFASLV